MGVIISTKTYNLRSSLSPPNNMSVDIVLQYTHQQHPREWSRVGDDGLYIILLTTLNNGNVPPNAVVVVLDVEVLE